MDTSLKGMVAIVTGGSQGIGRKISLTLAREGARVMLAARNAEGMKETASLIAASGGKCRYAVTDVTIEVSVRNMIEETLREWGTIDILVNNSGIAGPTKFCEDVEPDEWEECINVNIKGPFLCARGVIPVMKRNQWGRIVNISSITGKKPLVERTVYATSKLGLIGFMRSLALEAAPYGITVNAISPGAIDGDRIDRVIRAAAESEDMPVEKMRERFTRQSMLGRMATEQDIANMVLYLVSECGKNMTAQDINVCAGSVWY